MRIIKFKDSDSKQASKCISLALRLVNSKFYPKRSIDYLIKQNTPAMLKQKAKHHNIIVAKIGGKIVGTISLTKDGWIASMFVSPDYQNLGIGTKLIRKVESIAKKKGFNAIRTHCSINSIGFYKLFSLKTA